LFSVWYLNKEQLDSLLDELFRKLGNALDAGSRGATQGVFLVANIIASLVAVTSCVAMINAIVNWCAVLVGQDEITFQVWFGFILWLYLVIQFCICARTNHI